MKLPISIDPCPIVEAALEFRFNPSVPRSAVFGIFYNALSEWLNSEPEDLPILQLAENVRFEDPSLRHKTHYQFVRDGLIIQIGPDVCLISSAPEYIGWSKFSKEIFELLDRTIKSGIVESFTRLGFRYINFFEEKVLDNTNINVFYNEKPIDNSETSLTTSFEHSNFKSILRLSNNALLNDGRNGSIIDIDTFVKIDMDIPEFKKNYKKIIEEGHLEEKTLFVSLLKPEFLENFNPKY